MNAPDRAATTEAISRNYLHDEVAKRIRALIQSGALKPRERLNESELSRRFGISRTPLREAIKILTAEGLLESLPNRGAQVASISVQEIEDMLDVIAGLEALAAELACQKADESEIDTIASLTDEMENAFACGEAPAYFDLNQQIHEQLMEASHNPTLAGLYRNLSTRIQRARFTAHKTPRQWEIAMDEHRQMVALLRSRNAQGLAALVKAHVRSKKNEIVAQFG